MYPVWLDIPSELRRPKQTASFSMLLSMSVSRFSLIVTQAISSFSTLFPTSDTPPPPVGNTEMSITASAIASDLVSPSPIHVETGWQGTQVSASKIKSCRWKFLMKIVKARAQPGYSLDTLGLPQTSEKAEAMHVYLCTCDLCILSIRNRQAPYSRWGIIYVKKGKNDLETQI